jgi:hypothetical protein
MKKSHIRLIAPFFFALCAVLFAGVPTQVDAQAPGPHPHYLHAIRNLREARAKLDYPFKEGLHREIAASAKPLIDEAIGDLKKASRLDEKDLGAVPRPNFNLPENGTFHNISDLLAQAAKDVGGPEADPIAIPMRDHAAARINQALAQVNKAL